MCKGLLSSCSDEGGWYRMGGWADYRDGFEGCCEGYCEGWRERLFMTRKTAWVGQARAFKSYVALWLV